MASGSACLRGLHQLRLPAFTMRQSLAGRCLQSLHSNAADRHPSKRQEGCGTVHAAVRQFSTGALSACGSPGPRISSLPPPALLCGWHAGFGQRQLHTNTVCFGKKKSAEDLVKRITKDDVEFSFVRSSGAGGQNVNKVSTKVDLRLNIDKADWLPDDMKEALREKEKNRVNGEGELVMTSQKTRTQGGNMEDALQKLQKCVDTAALAVQPIEEDPEKKKKLAKQKKQANENRLQSKKMKSMKKSDRKAGKRPDY